MTKTSRAVMSLLLIAGLAAGCGTPSTGDAATTTGVASAGGSSAAPSADGPIKIAVIGPSSGALAQFGADAVDAWQFAVDEVNSSGGLLGRQVELVKKDTDGAAATTLREAKAAVTQDGASFIGAVMTSTEHGALNAQLDTLGALSINSLGKDDGLSGKDCNDNAFRVVQSTTMDVNAMAAAIDKIPGEKWAIQAVDYSTGHTSAEVFKAAAAKAGKEVVLEQYAPLNTTDFGTYITKIQDSGADALLAVEYGADGVAFVNQAAQFGLPAQLKSVLGFNMVSQPLFPALGDKVLGFFNNVGYDPSLDNELNKKFVEAWKAAHDGAEPYYVQADNYLGAQLLFEAIKKAGSTDVDAVRTAMEGLTFDSIVGSVEMRAGDHQLIRPSYVGQVEKDSAGELGFTLISESDGAAIMPPVNTECKL
ncbi:ABC transporter substrate-binding protein [Nakamurella sp. YIM 132087]|uniref:ABC transporter substrate-binding protein n=1 Tax=Nakamurella alba TaxID=2665158 RepID=A0A7K1FEH5_9ACTN|nr:ABC transporter substrate-binding protein [Nakamurella alba]MTD12505.1 ABC transporter substrate-binding protein [Nakamurella alba]